MVLTVSYQATAHSCLKAQFLYLPIYTYSVVKFYFQNTFVMKMNCGILEGCVAIVTKHKSSKVTPKLTFIVMKILLMSYKPRNQYLKTHVSIFSINE